MGISNFPASPHSVNKKAYEFSFGAFGATSYCERLGFNLCHVAAGRYTLVAEFFLLSMQNASMTAAIGAGSIVKQTSTTFRPHGNTATSIKTFVQINHVRTGLGTDYIYFDMHGDFLTPPSGSGRVVVNRGHMVVYGANHTVLSVPSSVFDQAYVVNNGRMELQTDLDLHGHRLMNNGQGRVSFDSGGVISLHDALNTNGYKVVGKNGGGFEVDDNGQTKLHEDLDLNGTG